MFVLLLAITELGDKRCLKEAACIAYVLKVKLYGKLTYNAVSVLRTIAMMGGMRINSRFQGGASRGF